MSQQDLLEFTNSQTPLILDGATGSLLQQKRFTSNSTLWMTLLNIEEPETILEIHNDYIKAGANIITTNTFRTNSVAFEGAGLPYESKYNKAAIDLAKEAIKEKQVFLAGSNAPAEDCYQKNRTIGYNKLEINHCNHIDLLWENGVHLILNETLSHFDEIKIISKYCSSKNILYILSLYFDNTEHILSGESISYVVDFVEDHNPLAIGFNCIAPGLFNNFITNIKLPGSWGFYLNCGSGEPKDESIECGVAPNEYADIVDFSKRYSPSFIGSCCGSNPDHIKAIRNRLNG